MAISRAYCSDIVTISECPLGCVLKSSTSINFENSPFGRAACLQYTVCSATKNKFLQFLKVLRKIEENIQKVISNGVPFQKLTDLQTAAFNLACF